MPPRARKSTDAKPGPDEPLPGDGRAQADDGEPQPPEPDADPAEITDPEPADEPGALGAAGVAGAAPSAPPEQTYHWESVNGDGSEPCRHCPPGTPPPGAGSYGCPHGQWVRVQDTT